MTLVADPQAADPLAPDPLAPDPLAAYPDLAGLYAYWEGKRGAAPIPPWSAFDPVEMRAWLGRLNVVGVDRAPDGGLGFVYRIFGTEIAEMLGRELTGRPVGDGDPAAAGELVGDYRDVVLDAAPILREHNVSVRSRVLRHVRLMLPVGEGGATVTRVLVGIRPLWRTQRSPLVSALRPAIDPDTMLGAGRLRAVG